jgi:hypothetical protein
MTEGPATWTVTSAGGGAATMDFSFEGATFTAHWSCAEGGLASYDFGSFSTSDLGGLGTLEVVGTSGSWLPSVEALEGGGSWSHEFTTSAAFSAEGFSVDITAETIENFTAGGVETVSVPAGTFDAIRVDGTTTTTVSGGPIAIPTVSSTQTFWFAPGVGIVRFTSSSEGYTSSGDLTSYSIP